MCFVSTEKILGCLIFHHLEFTNKFEREQKRSICVDNEVVNAAGEKQRTETNHFL